MKLHTRRFAAVGTLVCLVAALSGGCLSVTANVGAPGKGQDEGGARASASPSKEEKGPQKREQQPKKPFAEVTADTTTAKGLFTAYRKNGKFYWEIAPADLNKRYLFLGTLGRGIGVSGFLGGSPGTSFAFELRNVHGERIEIVKINSAFKADPGSPDARALKNAVTTSVFASLPVVSDNPDTKGWLVEMEEKLISDFSDTAGRLQRVLGQEYKLDPQASRVETAAVFPKNIEVGVLQRFASPKGGWHIALPDTRTVEVLMRYSISELEESGYRSRLADDRIGYFTTEVKNFSSDDPRDNVERYIERWHLVKKDPGAALSEPVNPIVFWVENSTPVKYREDVRHAILAWNRAFEKAGFKNAVEAKIMPDDADWDPADIRYNVIRWITSSESGIAGLGPARVNPLTGEILSADVLIEGEAIRGMRRYYLDRMVSEMGGDKHDISAPGMECDYPLFKLQDAVMALNALTVAGVISADEVPEEFVKQYIFGLISHEVGHVLGLRHNFKASAWRTPKELHDRKLTEENGLIGSVMEYDPVNLAPPGTEQGFYYTPVVGPYDLWAIEYGYRPLAADAPKGELPELLKIASRSGEPGLAYGTDEDSDEIDPYCVRYDQSSDPMAYSEQQIKLVLSMFPKIREKLLADGESYANIRNAFGGFLGSYINHATMATRFVGGQRVTRSHRGDPGSGDPVVPVPFEDQQRALDMIARYALSDEYLDFPDDIMNLLAPGWWWRWHSTMPRRIDYPLQEVIAQMRQGVLDDLYNSGTLSRLVNIEDKTPAGGKAMTIPHLFRFLREKIWSELGQLDGKAADDLHPKISRGRRNLQRMHLRKLIEVMASGEKGMPEDARTLARRELTLLRPSITKAIQLGDALDTYTRAHLEEATAAIDKALDAKMEVPLR